jgi:hypothetical protein
MGSERAPRGQVSNFNNGLENRLSAVSGVTALHSAFERFLSGSAQQVGQAAFLDLPLPKPLHRLARQFPEVPPVALPPGKSPDRSTNYRL